MNIPSRRKLAAATLIIAGLGAFLVPFLLHGPTTQATSPPNGGGGNNSNNGNPGGTSTSSNPGSGGSGDTGACSGNDPADPAHSQGDGKSGDHGKHKGLAKVLEDSGQHVLDKMAGHNPAFREHNATRTDNDVDGHNGHHNSSGGDQDSSCTSDTEDKDD